MKKQVQLAEDVTDFINERSKQYGVTFEFCLESLVRKEMQVVAIAEAKAKEANAKPYVHRPFSSGFLPGVDVENLSHYADDLMDEEIIRKMYGEEQS